MGSDEKFEALLTDKLLDEGLLSREDLTEVLSFQSRLADSQSMSFEDVLVAMEYISQSEVERIKAELSTQYSSAGDTRDLEQMQKFFETGLEDHARPQKNTSVSSAPPVHEKYTPLFPESEDEIKAKSAVSPLPEGPTVEKNQLLTPELMAMLGDVEPSDKPRLGEILLENNDLEEWQLVHALCVQKAAPVKPRLGTLLVQLGYSEHQAVKRALTIQIKQR